MFLYAVSYNLYYIQYTAEDTLCIPNIVKSNFYNIIQSRGYQIEVFVVVVDQTTEIRRRSR